MKNSQKHLGKISSIIDRGLITIQTYTIPTYIQRNSIANTHIHIKNYLQQLQKLLNRQKLVLTHIGNVHGLRKRKLHMVLLKYNIACKRAS